MQNRIWKLILALAICQMMALNGEAEEKKAAEKTVSAKAPAFKLKDQDGKQRSLEDFTKKGMVALVFYRSADW